MHQDNGCHSLSDYSDDFCIEEHNDTTYIWMKNSENFKSLYRNTKFRTAQSATEIRERVCLPMSKSKSFSAPMILKWLILSFYPNQIMLSVDFVTYKTRATQI